MITLEWESLENVFPPGHEDLKSERSTTYRARVPGGWRVRLGVHETFVPDAAHTWLGASLAKE